MSKLDKYTPSPEVQKSIDFVDSVIEKALKVKPPEKVVSVPLHIVEEIIRYCEDYQVHIKLIRYSNFYYKLKQIVKCQKS